MSEEGLNADVLKQKQRDRFRVLKGMYDASEEVEPGRIAMFTPDAVATSLEMDRAVVWRIFDYLAGEGLTEIMATQMTSRITHAGRVEVESFVENPDRGTPHFNFGPLTQNFHGPVGAVQMGENNTAEVNQTIGADTNSVLALIKQLRAEVPQLSVADRAEAEAELDDLEAEITTPVGKPNRMRKITDALGSLTRLGANVVKFGVVAHQIATEVGIDLPGQLPPSS